MDEVTEIKVHSWENQALNLEVGATKCLSGLFNFANRARWYFGKLIYNRLISSDHFIFFCITFGQTIYTIYVNKSL